MTSFQVTQDIFDEIAQEVVDEDDGGISEGSKLPVCCKSSSFSLGGVFMMSYIVVGRFVFVGLTSAVCHCTCLSANVLSVI